MGAASGLNSERIRHALPVPIYLHEKIQELEKTLGASKRDSTVEDGRLSYQLPLEMHKGKQTPTLLHPLCLPVLCFYQRVCSPVSFILFYV